MKKITPLLQNLPARTRKLFDRLASEPMLEDFVLVGGSALAIQIGHRISEDLDFVVLSSRLPSGKIDALTLALQNAGADVSLTTPQSAIVQFKINTGEHLLDYARDYVVDGARLSFFAQGFNAPDSQMKYLRGVPEAFANCFRFKVMGVAGLFALKVLVLGARARSRDLYDLKVLMQQNDYSIQQAEALVKQYAPASQNDFERHKALLTGVFPLDKQDEGFETLGVASPMAEVYGFFQEKVSGYEKARVLELLQQQK